MYDYSRYLYRKSQIFGDIIIEIKNYLKENYFLPPNENNIIYYLLLTMNKNSI